MIEHKIKNLLTAGGLILGLSSCASGYDYVTTREFYGEKFQCEEKRRGGVLVADKCSYYGATALETNYGPDGPGNENDERTYFNYRNENGTMLRPGTEGYGEVWFRNTAGLGGGNCDPQGKCEKEAWQK